MKCNDLSVFLLTPSLGGLSALLVYSFSAQSFPPSDGGLAAATLTLAVATCFLCVGTIIIGNNGAKSYRLEAEIYKRKVGKERMKNLEEFLNVILRNKDIIRNNEFLYGGVSTVRNWPSGDLYHVLVEFGTPVHSRSKELNYNNYVMIRNQNDYTKRLVFTFRGEHKVETKSIQIYSNVMENSIDSKWDDYFQALTGAFNILKGSESTANWADRRYKSKSVEDLKRELERGSFMVRGPIRMCRKIDWRMKEAVRTGNITEVKRVIDKVTHINARDEYGASFIHEAIPLHYMTRVGNYDEKDNMDMKNAIKDRMKIIKMIVKNGGDIDLKNDFGMRPLHYACWGFSPIDIFKLLIKLGANANWRTGSQGNERAPLHFLAKNGHVEAVKVLIENDADVNVVDETNGKTPLHSICEAIQRFRITDEEDTRGYGGRISGTAKLLIENGADVDLRCKEIQEEYSGYSFREFVYDVTINGTELTRLKSLIPKSS